MPFKTFLELKNNQVLIREYKIIGTDFERTTRLSIDEEGRSSFLFRKYPLEVDTNNYGFIDIFTLKEYFIHLLEEPVDNITWLRIKQPGTYTIHFDFIFLYSDSFSFKLHTRDEVIHFSEHNPKHDINLKNGENCLLADKNMPH